VSFHLSFPGLFVSLFRGGILAFATLFAHARHFHILVCSISNAWSVPLLLILLLSLFSRLMNSSSAMGKANVSSFHFHFYGISAWNYHDRPIFIMSIYNRVKLEEVGLSGSTFLRKTLVKDL